MPAWCLLIAAAVPLATIMGTDVSLDESDTSMNILMLGTRGLPAAYGGFETAIEQIAPRLVRRGHRVSVYGRAVAGPEMWQGVHLIHRAAYRRKTLETLSHTARCLPHALAQRDPVVVLFNAANAPLSVPFLIRRIPLVIHVDGLEWKRAKWSRAGQMYYRFTERLSSSVADGIVADARAIQDYYEETYGRTTTYIPYGTKVIKTPRSELQSLSEFGLAPHRYHLIVARFEPENHVREMVDAYEASDASFPLVVVGDAAYRSRYSDELFSCLNRIDSVRWLGRVDDSDVLDELYRGCRLYLHGHSVGGTNPSLLRAMGSACAIAACDVNFNREVLGDSGLYFHDALTLSSHIETAESDVDSVIRRGSMAQLRAADRYQWEAVAEEYERLLIDLAVRRYGSRNP